MTKGSTDGKEWNVTQFIKGTGCESFISQNPIQLTVFIACGSNFIYGISSLVSKSDKSHKVPLYILWLESSQHKECMLQLMAKGTHIYVGTHPWFWSISPYFVPFSPEGTDQSLSHHSNTPGKGVSKTIPPHFSDILESNKFTSYLSLGTRLDSNESQIEQYGILKPDLI